MKNLILYASRNNTTEETVLRIKSHAIEPLDIYKISETGDISSQSFIINMILIEIANKNHFDPNKADTRKEEAISELIKRF